VLNEEDGIAMLIDQLEGIGATEVVFVDGGSTDASQRILRARGVRWYESKPGRARQMNLGAAKVKSDIILFLHADTIIDSSNLESIRTRLQDQKVVAGYFSVRLSGSRPMLRVVEFLINWRSRMTKISTGDQAMFIRRDLFDRLGGFPDQPLMEDIEMSRRLKREGRIACLPGRVITSSRRWERFGIWRTILLMWRLRFRYWLGADPAKLKALYMDYP